MDGMEEFVLKIALALIGGIVLINFVSPALELFGLWTCSGCSSLVSAFMFTVMPFAIAFIGIYKIMTIFTSTGART